MQSNRHNIFYAKTLQELLYQIKSVAGLRIVGGCTAIDTFPDKLLSVRSIPELKIIDKHERYINFGTAVTLSEILDVSSSRIPEIFVQAIQSVANANVRNIATLGGNICSSATELKRTLFAPLLALDAQIEIRSSTKASWVPLINFTGVPQGYVATNMRIPTSEWDVSIFKRLGPENKIKVNSASFAFLAASEKNVITNIRIALAGQITFRTRELENSMIGTRLPLSQKDIKNAISIAENQFDEATKNATFDELLRTQFLNIMRYSMEQLT